jgi:hypothetical protein
MPVELVTVTTADGVDLDGAAYHCGSGGTRTAIGFLIIHGLKWNFYRGPARWLAPLLAASGFGCLALNMRDHDSEEPRDFHLAHHDVRAGVDAMAARCDEVILLAHGYGCTKAISYSARTHDERVRRRVLTTLGAVKRYREDVWREVLADAAAVRGRALVVQGGADPAVEGRARADEFGAVASDCRTDVVLLDGANHYFSDHHQELVRTITAWTAHTTRHD